MLLTIATTHKPATDLGYLLHKNPFRVHSFEQTFGKGHVFYPDSSPERLSKTSRAPEPFSRLTILTCFLPRSATARKPFGLPLHTTKFLVSIVPRIGKLRVMDDFLVRQRFQECD